MQGIFQSQFATRNKEIVGESTSDEIISDRLDGPQLEVETDQGASPADG